MKCVRTKNAPQRPGNKRVASLLLAFAAFALFPALAGEVLKIGEGQIQNPDSVSAAPNGDLIVLDRRGEARVILRFAPGGQRLGETPVPAELKRVEWVGVDSAGRFYLAGENKAWSLGADGRASQIETPVVSASLKKTVAGEFLFLLRPEGREVIRFDPADGSRRPIALSKRPAKGHLYSLRVRDDGHLYGYAQDERIVYHYDAQGVFVEAFGSGGDLRCGIPAGHIGPCFDVDALGDVYWTLADYGTLLRYTSDGRTGFAYRGQEAWDRRWTGPIHTLSGFALSGDYGYIADRGHQRLTGVPKKWVAAAGKDCDEVGTRCFGLRYDIVAPRPYKVFLGESADLKVVFPAGNRRLTDVVLRYSLRDLEQAEVAKGELNCALPGNAAAEFPLPLKLPRLGWYQLETAVLNGGDVLVERLVFLGRTWEDPHLPLPDRESSGWNDMATHKAFGMGLHRFHFQSDPKAFDETLSHIRRARELKVPFFLQITDKKDCTPANVRTVLEKIPDLPALEIVNEPNLNTSPADYVKLLKACYEAAKAVNPKVRVLGPAQCGTALGWFEAFFREGGGHCVDGVSVHTYMRHNSVDAYHWQWKLARLRETMARYGCGEKPLYQTEHGFLGDYHGHALRHRWQARTLFQEYLLLDRHGMWPDRHFYYYLNQGGFAGFSSYLIDARRELLPAALLLRTRASLLGDRRYARSLDFGPPADWLVLGNVYEGRETDLAILQNTGCLKPVLLRMDLPAGAKAFDRFGNPLALPSGRDVEVAVDCYPMYLLVPHGAALQASWPGFFRNLAGEARVEVDDPQAAAKARFLVNGALEFDFEDEPERDGFRASPERLPLDVTLAFGAPRMLSRAILYGSLADNDKCTPTAYDLWARVDGQWRKVDEVRVPVDGRALKLESLHARVTWYDNPWIAVSDFEPVLADAVRFHFTDTTHGQWPVEELMSGRLPRRVHLREVQLFGPPPATELRPETGDRRLEVARPVAVSVAVVRNAAGAFRGELVARPPAGWKATPEKAGVELGAQGDQVRRAFTFTPPAETEAGRTSFSFELFDAQGKPCDAASCAATFVAPLELGLQVSDEADGTAKLAVRVSGTDGAAHQGVLRIETTAHSEERPFEVAAGREFVGEFRVEDAGLPGTRQVLRVTAVTRGGLTVRGWQVVGRVPCRFIGPFDNADGKGFDAVYPPERQIDFAGSYPCADGTAQWTEGVLASDGSFDLARRFRRKENAVAYVVTHVHSPGERKAVLSLGSDDGIKAWVNGRLVVANDVARGAAPGQETVPVTLNAGLNAVLLKITQGGGGWGLYLQVLDAQGEPMTDLKFTAAP